LFLADVKAFHTRLKLQAKGNGVDAVFPTADYDTKKLLTD